jgi:hypothetical protein
VPAALLSHLWHVAHSSVALQGGAEIACEVLRTDGTLLPLCPARTKFAACTQHIIMLPTAAHHCTARVCQCCVVYCCRP